MKRRKFIKHAFHSVAIPGVIGSVGLSLPGKSLASVLSNAAENGRILVLIFLDGGNDGLNTVIPMDQLSQLEKARPNVFLSDNDLIELKKSDVGLHPSLSGFSSLYHEGRLGIVQNVGYADPDYSHFRSSDIWMSGSNSNEFISTGWSGRYLHHLHPGYPEVYPNDDNPDPLAVEIGWGSSMLFQGPTASMGMVISGPESFYNLVDNVEQEVPETPAGDKLKYIRLIARQSEQYGLRVKDAADKAGNQREYPQDNYLADQLKIVARLIAGGLQTPLYLVRHGGFDTHDSQVESANHTLGEHADLLKMLDEGVVSFMQDLEHLGIDDRVTGMTFSEFGRTIISNASGGTDHGTAAPLFVFGNHVKGGVLGTNPVIPLNATYANDLTMEYDFRQVYSSIIQQWFGSTENDSENVLLQNFETLPIIGESESYLSTQVQIEQPLKVFPNPLNNQASISCQTNGESISLILINMEGKKVADIYSGTSRNSRLLVKWQTDGLPRGRYFVIMQTPTRQVAFSVVK